MSVPRLADGSPRPDGLDAVSGSRPAEPSWRADALAGSRHSRLAAELRRPLESHDVEAAQRICAEVCRLALQDFAPALMLLPAGERSRVQALTAYTLTLFDFVRQTGLEGERLAAINRWEFELETALNASQPPGQPVFVLLHRLEQSRPRARQAFDSLHASARRRCTVARPADADSAMQDSVSLARSLAWLTLGNEPDVSISRWLAALLRLRGLTGLGDEIRRHRPQLPGSDLPQAAVDSAEIGVDVLTPAVEREVARIRELAAGTVPESLPARLQPAARYCHLGARLLLKRVTGLGSGLLHQPPMLGLVERLWLLLRASSG